MDNCSSEQIFEYLWLFCDVKKGSASNKIWGKRWLKEMITACCDNHVERQQMGEDKKEIFLNLYDCMTVHREDCL